jgi:hypothetical protein
MTRPILSSQEIVSNLRDSGAIGEAVAIRLEQRINACTAQAREEGRNEAIIEAVKKAEAAVNRTRGEWQKSSASRVLWAVKGLLPAESAMRYEIAKARNSGYHSGYRQGRQSADSERNPRGHR